MRVEFQQIGTAMLHIRPLSSVLCPPKIVDMRMQNYENAMYAPACSFVVERRESETQQGGEMPPGCSSRDNRRGIVRVAA